ncbi:ribosomal-protein-alanine N-acetyltransferase [Mergibacter septicus]|uniref:[Ribosomal protein bS18]-alanine N-acetyltransferase n=1 Tax=Mergibacter septicus TaxID=221402 RepID=A0A8E3MG88_9PAST|nr:ribosomal protein S18-alanine N-acetyltransferase [Mergibacter septicus]AWX15411.1 ribosomal-protein-alanine N-acetyltransferase [Mergibacter septicus]QDJ14664.1 ribosomal-protein-alanine N-acetyltransferase [Mergibacter septicus]UTU47904.1 ribosomal protein S18-alanine N-acetyltransferase [Mergibacter septicus]WMR96490.1 ribosomal protein S18-alanine N-acetyltransferase [Mergibacter septicus]
MSDLNITPLTLNDLPIILQIEQSSQVIPWRLQSFQECCTEQYINLKLTKNQEIIGYCICHHLLDEATLFNIAISPNFQAKGYGRLLLQYLNQQLQAKGCSTLWLEVRESNLAAQHLYQTIGFQTLTVRKEYYRTPDNGRENAVIMAYYF